jgi:hypothetical protein
VPELAVSPEVLSLGLPLAPDPLALLKLPSLVPALLPKLSLGAPVALGVGQYALSLPLPPRRIFIGLLAGSSADKALIDVPAAIDASPSVNWASTEVGPAAGSIGATA